MPRLMVRMDAMDSLICSIGVLTIVETALRWVLSRLILAEAEHGVLLKGDWDISLRIRS